MSCPMVCHTKFYTHVDIVYVLYGNSDPYRKWPDGTYRNVMLVHIARMSIVCFPVHLYSQERKKKRCVEVSPSHRRTVAPFHHRQPRWATFPMMPPAQGRTPPPKPEVPQRLDILFQISSLSKLQNGCAHAIRDGRFTLVGYHHMLVTFPLAKVINQTRRRTPLIS